jgi:tetratricopeptide (TPR) repeat protein
MSQPLFESLLFKQALEKAGQQNRLVLVVFDSKECQQCNEVASKGLENSVVKKRLDKDFVCIRPEPASEDWNDLMEKYGGMEGFGIMFFNSKGQFLNQANSSSSRAEFYLEQMDLAESNLKEARQIDRLTRSLSSGKPDLKSLEQLITKRQKLRMSNDSLIDRFVLQLPPDSLKSKRVLKLLARQCPAINSETHKLIRKDFDLFNQAWYTIDLQERITINNTIINKTRKIAVESNDRQLAMQVASFASGVRYDAVDKRRAYLWNMLEYDREIKDTLSYLNLANHYYNQYYMKISVDSIQKIDSIGMANLLAEAREKNKKQSGTYKVSYSLKAQRVAQELRMGAWNMYTFQPNEKRLANALGFSERANEFHQSPETLDTYARLLYKSGRHDEAIETETKAIEQKKKLGYPTGELEAILDKMKSGAIKIDNY